MNKDAHNLAWKIDSVVNCLAPSSIFHTYEKERMWVLLLPFLPSFPYIFMHIIVRLPFPTLPIVFETSKQPWPFLLLLVSIQLLPTLVNPHIYSSFAFFFSLYNSLRYFMSMPVMDMLSFPSAAFAVHQIINKALVLFYHL